MKKLFTWTILIMSIFSMRVWAVDQQQSSQKVKIRSVDCEFKNQFFRTSYRPGTRQMVVMDLVTRKQKVYNNVSIQGAGKGLSRVRYSNRANFLTLTFKGKTSNTRLFTAQWHSYQFGGTPVGECHTL